MPMEIGGTRVESVHARGSVTGSLGLVAWVPGAISQQCDKVRDMAQVRAMRTARRGWRGRLDWFASGDTSAELCRDQLSRQYERERGGFVGTGRGTVGMRLGVPSVVRVSRRACDVTKPAEADSQDRNRILSLGKAVEIVWVLSRSPSGLLLADISKRAGMNRSTVYRILNSLEHNRVVMRDDLLRYRLGFLVNNLGRAAVDQNVAYHHRAAMHLHQTARQLGATAFLAVRQHNRALYVLQAVYGDPHYVAYPVGHSLPLHVGAAGRVLLAFASADEIDSYLASRLERLTPATVVAPEELRKILLEIRRESISLTDGDITIGIGGCAAPICDAAGNAIAAVSISGPSSDILGSRETEYINATRELAARIGADLDR